MTVTQKGRVEVEDEGGGVALLPVGLCVGRQQLIGADVALEVVVAATHPVVVPLPFQQLDGLTEEQLTLKFGAGAGLGAEGGGGVAAEGGGHGGKVGATGNTVNRPPGVWGAKPLRMPKYYPFLLLLLGTCLSTSARAQDYHFSQYFTNPLTINPALTGLFPGNYRVAAVHRSQWGSVLETPFSTTAFAADFHYFVNPKRRSYKDAFGVGVLFASDRVSELSYSVNQIMLGGAFHKSLNPRNNQTLSLGVQFGVQQRSVSYDQFTFETQFDGTSTYVNGTSGEALPENNYAFGDYQVGLNYSSTPERATAVFAGVALYHIGEPEQSFFAEATRGEEIEVTNTLNRRFSGYFNVRIPFGREVTLSPRIYVFNQGPHLAANVGSNVRLLLADSDGTALHLGASVRPVRNFNDEYTLDSAMALVGIEVSNFLLGLSYDVGLAGLQTNPRHRGAFEFSVTYLGQSDDDEAVPCPQF